MDVGFSPALTENEISNVPEILPHNRPRRFDNPARES
jgi:hypothetical protein